MSNSVKSLKKWSNSSFFQGKGVWGTLPQQGHNATERSISVSLLRLINVNNRDGEEREEEMFQRGKDLREGEDDAEKESV